MSDSLTSRLNAILPKVTADDFLSGSGIGNEIAFYIFEYDPQEELTVRRHVKFLTDHIPKHKPGLCVKHVNLLDLVVDHLEDRKLLTRSFQMQREKGDAHLLKVLEAVLDAQKLAPIFERIVAPDTCDLVLISGVGSVFPLLRTHNLLWNLHARMGKTPLVMFYPGRYDGKFLRLFDKVKPSAYYRAFRLIP